MSVPSQVILRLQEFIPSSKSIQEISQSANISEGTIQEYLTNEPIQLTEAVASQLRLIAAALEISVVELIGNPARKNGIKLNLLEKAKQNGFSTEQLVRNLSQQSIKPAILAFYSTQIFSAEQFEKLKSEQSLLRICEIIGCKVEDLAISAELPITKLSIESFTDGKNLTLDDLVLLTELPKEIVEFIATQPMDISALSRNEILKLIGSQKERESFICMILVACKTFKS